MSDKWTPVPWRVDETKVLGAYGVWTDYATHPGHDGAGYESQICSVIMSSKFMGDVSREQRDANAKLIAAAPDLLAACRAALAYDASIAGRAARGDCELRNEGGGIATGDDLDALYMDWITKAREAIALAGG